MKRLRPTRFLAHAACLSALAMGLTTCGQPRRPVAPAPPPVAAAAPGAAPPVVPARPAFTLILTWFAPNQAPQTTQASFADSAACERGRAAALAEGQRLATDAAAAFETASAKYADHRYVGTTPIGVTPPPVMPSVPKVSAFCAAT